MANDDVTAVIACFNYGAICARRSTACSARAPGSVVVDDGSTDPETHAVLESLPEVVEVVRQENRGVCAARNAGLARVQTPYAIVVDADDRLAPGALDAMRGAARGRSAARLRVRHDALLRRVGGRAALPRLRRLPAALPAHDRALRPHAPRGDRGHRRLRPGLRDLRGLGALAERPRPRVARRRVDAVTLEYRRHPRARSSARTGGATAATTPPCGASTRRSTPAPASWRARAAWGHSSARCIAGSGARGRFPPGWRPSCTGASSRGAADPGAILGPLGSRSGATCGALGR